MDLKQLEYIIRIAEENNITKAAKSLFITQSALNQQLLKLEKELGTQLFHRSRSNWHLTEAGQIYINAAKDIINTKKDTYHKIYDVVKSSQKELSIGFTPGRGITMFSTIYPLFHKQYPDVQVHPHELSVKKQQQLIASGDLDLGFMTLLPKHYEPHSEYHHIETEELYLGVPINHPIAESITYNFSELDLKDLKDDVFVLTQSHSTSRDMTDQIFESAGFLPHILFETSNTPTIKTMIQTGLCCGFLPEYYVNDHDPDIRYFTLSSHPKWHIVSSYRKKCYVSQAMQTFISLTSNYWKRPKTSCLP